MHTFLLYESLDRYKKSPHYDPNAILELERFIKSLEQDEKQAAKVDRNLTDLEKFSLFKILVLGNLSPTLAEFFEGSFENIFSESDFEMPSDFYIRLEKMKLFTPESLQAIGLISSFNRRDILGLLELLDTIGVTLSQKNFIVLCQDEIFNKILGYYLPSGSDLSVSKAITKEREQYKKNIKILFELHESAYEILEELNSKIEKVSAQGFDVHKLLEECLNPFYYQSPEKQTAIAELLPTVIPTPAVLTELVLEYTFFKKPTPSCIPEDNFVSQHFHNEEKSAEYKVAVNNYLRNVENIGSFGSVVAKEILRSLGLMKRNLKELF